jgi:hypothetical protein
MQALTTTFTPASSCLGGSNIWQIYLDCPYSCSSTYFLQGPPSTYASGCLPPSYQGSEYTFYYPGICPSCYTSACTSVKSLGTYTVTVQICCPTRFVFLLLHNFRNYVYTLVSIAGRFQCHSTGAWQKTLGCVGSPFTADIIPVTASQDGTTSLTAVRVNTLTDSVNAYAIAIQIPVLSTNNKVNLASMPT